jgi:hypothetical protein
MKSTCLTKKIITAKQRIVSCLWQVVCLIGVLTNHVDLLEDLGGALERKEGKRLFYLKLTWLMAGLRKFPSTLKKILDE